MKALRILVVSSKYPPEYSGSGQRAHQTYLRLKKKYGVDFEVLCSSITENRNAQYDQDGVPVTRIACKGLPVQRSEYRQSTLRDKIGLRTNYFMEAVAVIRFFARNQDRFDAVHVFGNVAVTSMIISLCNRIAKPLLVEFCNEVETPFPYRPEVFKLFFKEEYHPLARLVCISRRLELMCRSNGVANPIWTRPNPVDTGRFFPERENRNEYRKRYTNFQAEDIVLVNVSNFIPRKNQIFLVEALRYLPDTYKLFLAGPVVSGGPNRGNDHDYLAEVRARIANLGLESRVQLQVGFVDRIDEVMKLGDVYVFPTRAEGLGTPMLESLCCGVPVVATRIEGITDEWIQDGKNGFLSELDPKEFAGKVQEAVKIPPADLIASAQRVSQEAGTDIIDEKYHQLLQDIVGHH